MIWHCLGKKKMKNEAKQSMSCGSFASCDGWVTTTMCGVLHYFKYSSMFWGVYGSIMAGDDEKL